MPGLTLALALLALPAITARTWREHPAIVEVRATVQAVARQAAAVSVKELCEDGREITRAQTPVGRLLSVFFGSGDSAATVSGTYDRRGVLRFVLVEAGAVNGTEVQYRFYFDARQQRLWLDQHQTGPGYVFTPADFERRFGPNFSRLGAERC